MDPKVTREIIKTSEVLKNKFRALKRSLQDVDKSRQEFFTPVLQPLEAIKQSVEASKECKSEPTPRKVVKTRDVWDDSPAKRGRVCKYLSKININAKNNSTL